LTRPRASSNVEAMGRRVTMVLSGGVAIAALLLWPPRSPTELSWGGLALLALPWAALALAVVLGGAPWTHAVFPASFAPVAITHPELFGPARLAGPGGVLTLLVVAAAVTFFLTAASGSRAPPPEPRPGWPLSRATLARGLGLGGLLAGAAALWLPLLSSPPRPATLALGVVATLALGLVAQEHLQALVSDPTLRDARAAEVSLRASLKARASRIPLGVALGGLTGLAGLAWYLRLGGAG
jgi:hypothetical protein